MARVASTDQSPDPTVLTNRQYRLFFVFEPIVVGLLIFPLLIIFWQAGWNFMIQWFTSPSGQHPAIVPVSYIFSQLLFLFIYLNQDRLYRSLARQKSGFCRAITLQCHSFVTAFGYVIQWASMWTLWDLYTTDDWLIMLLISIAAALALIALTGHSFDLVCAPFIMSYDSIEYNIRIGTSLVTEKMHDGLAHVLNYILYEHVISLLTILAWRGSYSLLDAHIYPENADLSAGISLAIGYPLFFILMYTQRFSSSPCLFATFINGNFPAAVQNLRHLLAFIACVFLWRGFWIIFDTHIATIPFAVVTPYLFYTLCMFVSFIILSLVRAASSINGPMSQMTDDFDLFPLYSNSCIMKWFGGEKKTEEMNSSEQKLTDIEPYKITLF